MAQKYRYPGTKSFSFEDRSIFFGRNEDISNLCTSVIVNASTLLFGKSGTGKSSIIQAGLIPMLQERRSDADAVDPQIVINVMPKPYETGKDISAEVNKILLQKLSPVNNFLNIDGPPESFPLWYILKQFHYRQASEAIEQTILLIFDQAEELFTYPDSQIDRFVEELRPVIGQFIPANIQNLLNQPKTAVPADQRQILRLPLPTRFIFSIRSDKLHLVTRLKKASPLILHNSYELLPLKKENAFEAIDGPSQLDGEFASKKFEVTQEAKEYIFQRLSEQPGEPENNFEEVRIEPFSLQLICSHIEQKIVPRDKDKKIEQKELKEPARVINGYYKDTIDNLPAVTDDEKNDARNLIEFKMISGKRRVPMHEALISKDKYKISETVLAKLVDARILKRDHSVSGGMIYEITHDCFIDPILEAKAERLGTSDDNLLETIIDLLKKIKSKESFTTGDDPLKKRTVNLEKTSKKGNLSPGSRSSAGVDEHELYELYKKVGDAYNLTKDYKNAIKYFDKALKLPNKEHKSFFIDVYKARSDTHYYQHNYDLSNKDLKELLKLDPNEPGGLKYLVDNYDEQDKLAKAIKFFNTRFRITNKNAGVYIEIGNKYYAKMEFQKAKEYYLKTIKKDPKSEIALRNAGLCEESLKNIDKALFYYKKALELKPDWVAIYNDIGNILYARYDFVNARKYYRTASKKDPEYLFPIYNMGLVEEALLNWDGAIKNYQKVIALDPKDENGLFRMASVYFERKDYEKARQICTEILAINPEKSECYFGLGQIEEALKNSEAAIQYYQKAADINPKYEDAYIRIAGIYFEKKEYGKAKDIFTRLIAINPNEEANYYDMGMLEESLGNKEEGIKNYEKAIKINPRYEDPIARLVNIYFENSNFLQAKSFSRMLVTLNPHNGDYLSNCGRIEQELKNDKAAIDLFNKARRINPANEEALLGLGSIYFNHKDFIQAKKYYTTLVATRPANKTYYSDLGYIENELQNKNAAITHYKKALKIDPKYENALLRLAKVYFDKGDFVNAKKCYATLLKIDPLNENNHTDIGLIEERLGNIGKATIHYKKALDVNPESQVALEGLGGIYFDGEDFRLAKKYYTKLLSLNGKNSAYYTNLGYIESELKNKVVALSHYKHALKIDPECEPALSGLANIYFATKKTQKAKECFTTLISIDARNENYYNDMGVVEEELKNFEAAILNYKKALKLSPRSELVLRNLVNVYTVTKEYQKAKETSKSLISINPGKSEYFYNLGLAEEKLNNKKEAQMNYKKVLKLNPGHKQAKKKLKLIGKK